MSMLISRSKPHAAFTLVELLVVIAIIGILVGLLLPAVQAAREAARRTHCANNMKQLATGVLLFHDSHSEFPGAGESYVPNTGNNHSWMTLILPYIEQQALYDLYKFERTWNHRQNTPVTRSPASNLPMQLCPSAPAPAGETSDGRGDYAAVLGVGNYSGDGAPKRSDWKSGQPVFIQWYARGESYAAGALVCISPKDKDVLRNKRTKASSITDGTSQTFLLGECSHRDKEYVADDGTISYDNTMYWGTGDHAFAHHQQVFNDTPNNEHYSEHPGGLTMCMADGSVHFMSETIQKSVFDNMATRAFDEVVEHQW